jgi:hypothetical protein
MRYENIWYQWPTTGKKILLVIHHISLVKGAMNSPRICKMRNGVNIMFQFRKPSAQ